MSLLRQAKLGDSRTEVYLNLTFSVMLPGAAKSSGASHGSVSALVRRPDRKLSLLLLEWPKLATLHTIRFSP